MQLCSNHAQYGGLKPLYSSLFSFIFVLFVLAHDVNAASLLETLRDIPELSTFNAIINGNDNLTNLYFKTKTFTVLAPSNNALEAWLDPSFTPAIVEATMRYHFSKKSFTTEEFRVDSVFAHTHLESDTYANVSDGQVVELLVRNGKEVVLSGDQTESRIVAKNKLATGGFIQVIDRVLSVPLDLVSSISNFDVFTTVLNIGGFINQDDVPVIKKVIRTSDLTFFAPNTPEAVDAITAQSKILSKTQLEALFAYHVVPSVIFSNGLKDGMSLKTLQGQNLTVRVIGGDTYLDSAKVLMSDNLIANGVLHTVDNLLNPNNVTSPAIPIGSPTPSDSGSPKGSGFNAGAKAGIAIGVIAIVVILGALIVFAHCRRTSRHKRQDRERDDSSERGLDKSDVSDRSVASQRGDQQVIAEHTPHITRHDAVPVPEFVIERGATSEIELENRRRSDRMPVQNVNKRWEYHNDAVELDGSGIRT